MSEENIYELIKNDIGGDYYQNTYSNDGQRFIAWYLHNIHNLDLVEIAPCVTDGPNDNQIDAVYINEDDKKIYIIQGKFYSSPTVNSEPVNEVISAWLKMLDLPKLQESANQRLKERITDIERALEDDYSVCFELITSSELTESAANECEIFKNKLDKEATFYADLSIVTGKYLQLKSDEALNNPRPYINHDFTIEPEKFMTFELNDTKVVVAAVSIDECLDIPGIREQTLFRKNVRQSLGTGNKVNRLIAETIKNSYGEFFFYHNGITAICNKIDVSDDTISVTNLSVVNGCQSLTTMLNASSTINKNVNEGMKGYVLFRFYEVPDQTRAEQISVSTNSQTSVKARDLHSNDTCVKKLKKKIEEKFKDSYLITKRGEVIPKDKEINCNKERILELGSLGKMIMAWYLQNPSRAYSESEIFDRSFSQIFNKSYNPNDLMALNELYLEIMKIWDSDSQIPINADLKAMKSYTPYHLLFTVSAIVWNQNSEYNLQVPKPYALVKKLKEKKILNNIIRLAVNCLGGAMNTARNAHQAKDPQNKGRAFSPNVWSKSAAAKDNIINAVTGTLSFYLLQPDSDTVLGWLKDVKLTAKSFEPPCRED